MLHRFGKGLLAVWIGGGIGQSLAFLLARYLIGDFVSSLLRGKSRKWDVVCGFCPLDIYAEPLTPLVP